ncbi:alpha/beta fold hydrolase [Streptomyces sp. NBC_01565]|uniref:alpha/beta fold hydrolase n=1 Tax=Streptomyces sp. NBC_01565 TaxID=2975881 RepID=UPI002252203F|nr:alpha/beta hydrolase [Streptomyces sp. NBC_01565]MCX4545470.1 alpha/beta hydrolase [Streptomyces sp. NBC_01565]
MSETIESFLTAAHRTFVEVTRREPGYFGTRPLRAGEPPQGAAAAVAAAFGVTLRPAGRREFTAVDDLLDRRRRASPPNDPPSTGRWEGWRERQDRRGAVRAARAAHLARAMDRRAARRSGRGLRYRAGGQGSLLVLLTALGHTDEVWHPLAERLLAGRRVVMWDAGEDAPSGGPWTLDGQLADIDAVLAAEGAESCDVVAWCSGAQIAVEYAHRRPDTVRAAVLLHGSYPRAGGDPSSAYERNLGAVCASVAARPERAARALRALGGEAAPVPLPDDEHRAAVEVLARTPPGLDALLRRPFRDARALVRYSRQLTELWQRPIPAPGPGLPPLLSLGGELDRIAAPEPPAALVPLLTGGHGLLVGATHYSLLDRPDVVAAVCGAFLDDPAAGPPVAAGGHEIRWNPVRPVTSAGSVTSVSPIQPVNPLHEEVTS